MRIRLKQLSATGSILLRMDPRSTGVTNANDATSALEAIQTSSSGLSDFENTVVSAIEWLAVGILVLYFVIVLFACICKICIYCGDRRTTDPERGNAAPRTRVSRWRLSARTQPVPFGTFSHSTPLRGARDRPPTPSPQPAVPAASSSLPATTPSTPDSGLDSPPAAYIPGSTSRPTSSIPPEYSEHAFEDSPPPMYSVETVGRVVLPPNEDSTSYFESVEHETWRELESHGDTGFGDSEGWTLASMNRRQALLADAWV